MRQIEKKIMKAIGRFIFADEGKVLYRKRDGRGPVYAVKLGFTKNSKGIVVPDTAENYEERER